MVQPSAGHQIEDGIEALLTDQNEGLAGDVRDPYPELAHQRRQAPVMRVDLRAQLGMSTDAELPPMPDVYTVLTHDLVQRVLRDPETFSSAVYEDTMGLVMGKTILQLDPPNHRGHRNLVAQAFRPKMLERWGPAAIGETVNELIDTFADRGHADLVREFTFPFPIKVISRILGLPEEDWLRFFRLSVELISLTVDFERAVKASEALKGYFQELIDMRRAEPREDLISELVQAELDGRKLTDDEIYPFLRLLLPAGAETTFRSTGNLLYGLLTNPDQLHAVREDRALIPRAIEEAIRWEPPLLFIQRRATRDVELDGVEIPAGSNIALGMGAANRDPDRWTDPDVFDIHRSPQQHMSFADGPHMCLGMHLSRLETRIALNALFDRLPNLRLDPDAEDVHIHGFMFRSPMSLPVLFDN
ncbi:MAG: cytochrome P450 [Actinophytocola sp.]|nr:cytochrome P450 [Actinophytocola sp.]